MRSNQRSTASMRSNVRMLSFPIGRMTTILLMRRCHCCMLKTPLTRVSLGAEVVVGAAVVEVEVEVVEVA